MLKHIQQLTTTQILDEVDKLMLESPGWKPHKYKPNKGSDVSSSTRRWIEIREKKRKKYMEKLT